MHTSYMVKANSQHCPVNSYSPKKCPAPTMAGNIAFTLDICKNSTCSLSRGLVQSRGAFNKSVVCWVWIGRL